MPFWPTRLSCDASGTHVAMADAVAIMTGRINLTSSTLEPLSDCLLLEGNRNHKLYHRPQSSPEQKD
eukprot:1932589-Amphidinium_carterae.1